MVPVTPEDLPYSILIDTPVGMCRRPEHLCYDEKSRLRPDAPKHRQCLFSGSRCAYAESATAVA
jgi:hypothetical protein